MSNREEMMTKVKDIKQGDEFRSDGRLVWTALEDAKSIDAEEPSDYGPNWVRVLVRHEPDGGTDYRTWDDPELELPINVA